jgi:hypothetical protein
MTLASGPTIAFPLPSMTYALSGGYYDIDNMLSRPIDFRDVVGKLAGHVRFDGTPGALPVAQHAVMGAEAILNEGGSAHEAVLFLHHDDHEFLVGDLTIPVVKSLEARLPGFRAIWDGLRAEIDAAIYAALKLPPPTAWDKKTADKIALMDARMATVEAMALFGPQAIKHRPAATRKTPRFTNGLSPAWPAAKAEEKFFDMHRKLTGRTIR